jgi:hypothetical protein
MPPWWLRCGRERSRRAWSERGSSRSAEEGALRAPCTPSIAPAMRSARLRSRGFRSESWRGPGCSVSGRNGSSKYMACAEKVASGRTGDKWQAGTLIGLDWAGMSGSKNGIRAGLRIRLRGLLRSTVICYGSSIKPEPFRQSCPEVISIDTTCRRNSRALGTGCVSKNSRLTILGWSTRSWSEGLPCAEGRRETPPVFR